jgi:hypothetical protein
VYLAGNALEWWLPGVLMALADFRWGGCAAMAVAGRIG